MFHFFADNIVDLVLNVSKPQTSDALLLYAHARDSSYGALWNFITSSSKRSAYQMLNLFYVHGAQDFSN